MILINSEPKLQLSSQVRRQLPSRGLVLFYSCLFALNVGGFQVISFLPEYLDLPNRLITVVYRAIIAMLCAVAFVIGLTKYRNVRPTLGLGCLGLFWLFYLYRLFLDTTWSPVPLELPVEEYFAYTFGVSLMTLLAFLFVKDERCYRWAMPLCLLLGVITCVGSLYYNLSDPTADLSRMMGNLILTSIPLGHAGVTIAVLGSFYLFNFSGKRQNIIVYGGCLISVLLGVTIVFMAASRGPLVALVVLFIIIVWMGWRRRARIQLSLLAIGLVAALPEIVRRVIEVGTRLDVYFGSTEAFIGSESTLNRYDLMKNAWQQFLEHTILGSSLLERTWLTYPHNTVVESFMATGLMGGIPFCVVVVAGLIKAFRLFLKRPQSSWIPLLFLQAFIGSSFSGCLYYDPFFWGTLGALLGIELPIASGGSLEATSLHCEH